MKTKTQFISYFAIAAFLVFLTPGLSWAQQNFEGFIDLTEDKSIQLVNPAEGTTLVVRALTAEADLHLKKLKQHDFIRASGEINNKVLLLNRIEQVGLTQLLGKWVNETDAVLFDFRSYSDLTLAYEFLTISLKKINLTTKYNYYNYVVAPALGSGWRIFLTDDKTVSLGSLFLDQQMAKIELYSPENGQVIQTINLKKKGPQN